MLDFPDIDTGELQPEGVWGCQMLKENHKHLPFCWSVTIEILFIPTFFSSPSHITLMLLIIEVKFPVKFMSFC